MESNKQLKLLSNIALKCLVNRSDMTECCWINWWMILRDDAVQRLTGAKMAAFPDNA